MKDKMGDRFKRYEASTNVMLPRRTNTIIRVDGKAFHTFTKGCARPYDSVLATALLDAMRETADSMQGCVLAYRQSDEMSFLLQDYAKPETDAFFDGKVQKIASVCASMVTAWFNKLYPQYSDQDWNYKLATFDARVFTIPDPVEVANYFLWRNKDAYRNALSMYFQNKMGHKWCHGKKTKELAGILTEEEYISLKKDFWNGTIYEVKQEYLDSPRANFPYWEEVIGNVLPGGVTGSTEHSECSSPGSNPGPVATEHGIIT